MRFMLDANHSTLFDRYRYGRFTRHHRAAQFDADGPAALRRGIALHLAAVSPPDADDRPPARLRVGRRSRFGAMEWYELAPDPRRPLAVMSLPIRFPDAATARSAWSVAQIVLDRAAWIDQQLAALVAVATEDAPT